MVQLTHWGRVTHICVSKLTIIGSDNGLSPGRRQVIIWTNAGILLIGALGTNVSEILIKIGTFSLKNMLLKMSSGKRRPSCLGLNVLISIDCGVGCYRTDDSQYLICLQVLLICVYRFWKYIFIKHYQFMGCEIEPYKGAYKHHYRYSWCLII